MTITTCPGTVDALSSLIAPACCCGAPGRSIRRHQDECSRFDLSQMGAGIVPPDNAAAAPSGRFRPAGVATEHPGDERHPHELRQASRLHLGHEIRTINL